MSELTTMNGDRAVETGGDLSPWTAAEQPDADCVLDVSGTKLHILRALLAMCSPVIRDLSPEDDADVIPVLGFEPSQVSSFLECIHPGILVETTTRRIIEAAPVAHYFQAFALLGEFVLWLKQFNERGQVTDDVMDAILLVERLRERTPGQRSPWGRNILLEAERLFAAAGAGASEGEPSLPYDCDLWRALKPETQVLLLECVRTQFGKWLHSEIGMRDTFITALRGWVSEAGFMMFGDCAPLFRASRDGFEPSAFHRLCDEAGSTLTIIRSGDSIFGGFLDISWKAGSNGLRVGFSDGYFHASNKAFLFSLCGPNTPSPTKLPLKHGKHSRAIYDTAYGQNGPCFGDKDLWVWHSQSGMTISSVGNTFAHPTNFGATNEYFAKKHADKDARSLSIDELEVFAVKPF